jgi:hypothetical protein
MSEPVTESVVEAVLLVAFTSFVAPVVPEMVKLPVVAFGVPATVQVIDAPGASGEAVGTVGTHVVVNDAGRPETAQVAAAAATAGDAAFEQVNVLE